MSASSSAKPQNALVIARGGRQRKLLTEPVLFEEQGLPMFVRSGLIAAALEKHQGNQTRAAAYLDITRSALLYRMQKYGLDRDRPIVAVPPESEPS